jgi:hypothetical protein
MQGADRSRGHHRGSMRHPAREREQTIEIGPCFLLISSI